MFMCSQNEEDSKEIQDPGQGVQEVPAPRRIFCDKEVEHGQDDSVTTEHVISTRMYSSQSHSKATPYCKCPLEFCPNIAIQLKNSDNKLSKVPTPLAKQYVLKVSCIALCLIPFRMLCLLLKCRLAHLWISLWQWVTLVTTTTNCKHTPDEYWNLEQVFCSR